MLKPVFFIILSDRCLHVSVHGWYMGRNLSPYSDTEYFLTILLLTIMVVRLSLHMRIRLSCTVPPPQSLGWFTHLKLKVEIRFFYRKNHHPRQKKLPSFIIVKIFFPHHRMLAECRDGEIIRFFPAFEDSLFGNIAFLSYLRTESSRRFGYKKGFFYNWNGPPSLLKKSRWNIQLIPPDLSTLAYIACDFLQRFMRWVIRLRWITIGVKRVDRIGETTHCRL